MYLIVFTNLALKQDYLGFKTELDRREPLYLKIGEKVLTGRALKITRGDWEKLDIKWQEVDEQVWIFLKISFVYCYLCKRDYPKFNAICIFHTMQIMKATLKYKELLHYFHQIT